MILQVCDDFLDELLTNDIASDGVVPDIGGSEGRAGIHSTSMLDFMVKEEPLCEDDLRAFQKDRVKKDNHNQSKYISIRASIFIFPIFTFLKSVTVKTKESQRFAVLDSLIL